MIEFAISIFFSRRILAIPGNVTERKRAAGDALLKPFIRMLPAGILQYPAAFRWRRLVSRFCGSGRYVTHSINLHPTDV